jgi:hypothetical protein
VGGLEQVGPEEDGRGVVEGSAWFEEVEVEVDLGGGLAWASVGLRGRRDAVPVNVPDGKVAIRDVIVRFSVQMPCSPLKTARGTNFAF